jgi:hypothetical protein
MSLREGETCGPESVSCDTQRYKLQFVDQIGNRYKQNSNKIGETLYNCKNQNNNYFSHYLKSLFFYVILPICIQ